MTNQTNINVELWSPRDYSIDSVYKHIAKCARVCYQANKKKRDESEYDYLCRVLFKGLDIKDIKSSDLNRLHLSVLEHGTIYLTIPKYGTAYVAAYENNPYSTVRYINDKFYVTTNLRVIVEESQLNDLAFIVDRPTLHTIRHTFSIIADIGCSRELNRHRTHSVSEESTRYCNYSANKFQNNINTIKLPWVSDEDYINAVSKVNTNSLVLGAVDTSALNAQITKDWKPIEWYLYSIEIANMAYKKMIEGGWRAQQAREILPLATKTQVIHTAFINDWNHFIDLRYNEVSGKCHPIMKEVAKQIKESLYESR